MEPGNKQALASVLATLESDIGPWPKAVAVMSAQGFTSQEIANIFDMPFPRVDELVKSSTVIELVQKIQTRLGMSPEQRLATMLPTALEVMQETLNKRNVKPEVLLRLASDVADRNLGKPVQTQQTIAVTVTANTPTTVVNERFNALSKRLAALETKKQQLLKAGAGREMKDVN